MRQYKPELLLTRYIYIKMIEMETAQLRAQLHEYIENADERLLHLVHGLFAADMQERDWGSDLNHDLKASLNRAVEQLENGQGRSHDAVMKEFRAKYQG